MEAVGEERDGLARGELEAGKKYEARRWFFTNKYVDGEKRQRRGRERDKEGGCVEASGRACKVRTGEGKSIFSTVRMVRVSKPKCASVMVGRHR